jgi:hypothetical protein
MTNDETGYCPIAEAERYTAHAVATSVILPSSKTRVALLPREEWIAREIARGRTREWAERVAAISTALVDQINSEPT